MPTTEGVVVWEGCRPAMRDLEIEATDSWDVQVNRASLTLREKP